MLLSSFHMTSIYVNIYIQWKVHFNDNKSVASGKVKWTCLRFRNLPKLQEVKLKFWLLFFPTNTPQPSRVTKTFSQNETWLLDYKMDWLYSHCVWLPWGIDTTSKTSPQIWVFLQITLSCPPPSHHQLSHGLLHNLPTNLVAEKGEETEIQSPTWVGSWKTQRNSKNTSTSASLTMLKPLCRSQKTVENS